MQAHTENSKLYMDCFVATAPRNDVNQVTVPESTLPGSADYLTAPTLMVMEAVAPVASFTVTVAVVSAITPWREPEMTPELLMLNHEGPLME